MVRRIGAGASIAAAYLFSILVVANLIVVGGSQSAESLASQTRLEVRTYYDAHLLSGVLALDVLDGVQSLVSGGPFECSMAINRIQTGIRTLGVSLNDGTSLVDEKSSLAPTSDAIDNMTMLRPFDGSASGDLAVAVKVLEAGGSSSLGVSLNKTELHILSLPVRLDAIVSFCMDSVGTAGAILQNSTYAFCTPESLEPTVSAINSTQKALAKSLGFGYSLEYSVDSSGGCAVNFVSQVSQAQIDGPLGQFVFEVQQAGSTSIVVSTR